MTPEHEKAMKHIADARRELGALAKSLTLAAGQRIAMDRALLRLEHAEKRLSEATVWAAERRRREEQGVDVCEACSADVPWGTGATDEEGVTLCPSCLGEEVAA